MFKHKFEITNTPELQFKHLGHLIISFWSRGAFSSSSIELKRKLVNHIRASSELSLQDRIKRIVGTNPNNPHLNITSKNISHYSSISIFSKYNQLFLTFHRLNRLVYQA